MYSWHAGSKSSLWRGGLPRRGFELRALKFHARPAVAGQNFQHRLSAVDIPDIISTIVITCRNVPLATTLTERR